MNLTNTQLKDKLVNLTKREVQLRADKKAIMKDYNDQIKDVKDEIKEVIDILDETAN